MRLHIATLPALAAAALLAGCAGAHSSAGATSGSNGDREMLTFVTCMRAHGVDMADPVHRPGHSGLSIDLPERGPATTVAYGACGHILQPLVSAKAAHIRALSEPVRLGLVHYAECMREHGIPMLDPTPDGQLNLGNVPGINTGFGRYSPQFRLADQLCRRLLPGGIQDNGTGP